MDTVEDTTPATTRTAVPTWYWIVAVLALCWGAVACFAYVSQVTMSAAEFAALPPEQQDMLNALPVWVTGVYAVAVWSALGGAIGLLLRKAWAYHLFVISLVAVVVQFGWIFLATDILATMGISAIYFPLFIFVVGTFLVWFSEMARTRGWIG